MPFYTLVILALVQGITEFLPISSSGHLVLVHEYIGGSEDAWGQNLMLDVAVHVGTLFAVLIYFYKDIVAMLSFRNTGMIFKLIVASIPVIIAGYILHQLQPPFMRSLEIMAWMTIIFGVVLWAADRTKRRNKTVEKMGYIDAFLIGCAQMFALVPGTSRSGVTMSAARFLGYSRTESARFSLLLSIVALAGAGTLLGKDVIESGNAEIGAAVLWAAGMSFLAALASIALLMRFLANFSFTVFAVYRIILGGILLAVIYGFV